MHFTTHFFEMGLRPAAVRMLFIKFAARRGGAPIQFFQNWENDAIFCNPILSIPNFKEIENWENGIVFAYGFVPFNSSNWGCGENAVYQVISGF